MLAFLVEIWLSKFQLHAIVWSFFASFRTHFLNVILRKLQEKCFIKIIEIIKFYIFLIFKISTNKYFEIIIYIIIFVHRSHGS